MANRRDVTVPERHAPARRFHLATLLAALGICVFANGCAEEKPDFLDPFAKSKDQKYVRKDEITIEGRITSARTGAPVPEAYVVVELEGSKGGTPHGHTGCMKGGGVVTTDADGRYRYHARLADLVKEPPGWWGASLRVYKPGWRLDPPLATINVSAEKQTDFALVPAERPFDQWLEDRAHLYAELCQPIDEDRGRIQWHRALFDEAYERYCKAESAGPLDYKTFYSVYNAIATETTYAQWYHLAPTPESSEQLDALFGARNKATMAALPTYRWPLERMYVETETAPDLTVEQKQQACAYFRSLRDVF